MFFSSTYAPNVNTPEYACIYDKIKSIFKKYNHNGIVKYDYDTEKYIGSI